MKKRFLIGSILVILFLLIFVYRNTITDTARKKYANVFDFEYIPKQTVQIETTSAFLQKDSIYFAFRKDFRLHYQTIGIADFADSSKLIIISAPPPHTHMDTLSQIFKKFNTVAETRKHRIGYDGFEIDILLSMANATQENVENLLKKISKHLFFSDYKPAFLRLQTGEKRRYFMEENLDYQISLYEFNQWFIEDNERFMNGTDRLNSFPFQTFLDHQKHGVFFSQTPGFVAWSMPKKSDISKQIHNIRQFTLDADLILGAISDTATLVIIGRERECELTELPPLNVETILLLASITEKELSQSLDINDLMAGKMPGGNDWCPTYLSKELENTEFGDLLTLTDILLKDWSENGSIQEINYNYPEPNRYPFDRPLFRKLGLDELVYNWNTADAMYAIELNNKTIYTLNRTGALPVSYFNSQANSISVGSSYERQAYNYFAALNNADLVRVVQYTAIYQLFIDNEIQYQGETFSTFPKNKPYLLQEPLTVFLKNIQAVSAEKTAWIADSISRENFKRYQHPKVMEQLALFEKQRNFKYSTEHRARIFAEVQQNSKQQLISAISSCSTMLKGLSEEQFTRLCRYLSYPRGLRSWDEEAQATYYRSKKVRDLANLLGKPNFVYFGVDLNDVKNFFSNRLSGSSAPYFKSSSAVITYHDLVTTGGHNLSSRISRVSSLTNYKRSSGRNRQTPSSAPASAPDKPSKGLPKSGSPKANVNVPTSSTSEQKIASKPFVRSRNSVIPAKNRKKRGF